MAHGDVNDKPDAGEASGTPPGTAPGSPAQPAAPTPPAAPAPAEPPSAAEAFETPPPPVEPSPPAPAPEEPTRDAPLSPPPPEEPAPAPDPPAPPEEPVDETADLVRVGQVGSGRRLAPVDDETLRAIRDFASHRHLPGLGTLLDLARAHATSGRGPGLGVEVFTEIRSQLGRLVADLDAVAIHVGPVLFVKTIARNQPGTALRWLSEDERRALRGHPELLDQPARLAANLKKLVSEED